MDLKALFSALWRRRWILIIVPSLAGGAALAIRLTGEWSYKSSAQLSTGLTISDEVIEKSRLNPYEVQVTFNNLIEIIKSRSVLGQVSYRLMLHDLQDSSIAYRKPERSKLKDGLDKEIAAKGLTFRTILRNRMDSIKLLNPNIKEEKILQKLIDAYEYDHETLLKNMTVNRVNQSDFIEVSFVSENAHLSADIVNTICSEFIHYYQSTKNSRSTSSLVSLELIAQQRKEYLDQKVLELQNFKSNTDIINSTAESEAKIRQVKNYEDQITDEQQNIRSLQLTLANINDRLSNVSPTTKSSTNDEIVVLRNKIQSVNERYITGGQTNNTLLDSLKILRITLDGLLRSTSETPKLTTADLNLLRDRREETTVALEIARQNMESLNTIYNSLRYSMGEVANKETMANTLEKEVEVARQEYSTAQNRWSEAKEKLMTNGIAISQVLVAEPADKVESRKTLLFMMFSGVLSFMLCAFVIVGIELLDPRIKNPQRLKQLTRLKYAGSIPKLPDVNQNWDTIFNSNGKNFKVNDEVRKIRFEIDTYKPRVLLVSSLREGQGKSFFIVALAYSLSLQRKRVLLIDTNLRNNSLTRMLVAQSNLKLLLENFVANAKLIEGPKENGGTEAKTFDQKLISRTQNSFIDIIGNKKSQLSPSEVIPGGDFKVLLEWLKVQYDYILLEGPSLNLFSDSKELMRFVDLVVPVFSADSAIDTNDAESLNYLKSLQGKLGPAVLNNVENV